LQNKKERQNLQCADTVDVTFVGDHELFSGNSECVAFVFVRERCVEKFQV